MMYFLVTLFCIEISLVLQLVPLLFCFQVQIQIKMLYFQELKNPQEIKKIILKILKKNYLIDLISMEYTMQK